MKVIMHKAATKNCGYLFEVEQNSQMGIKSYGTVRNNIHNLKQVDGLYGSAKIQDKMHRLGTLKFNRDLSICIIFKAVVAISDCKKSRSLSISALLGISLSVEYDLTLMRILM